MNQTLSADVQYNDGKLGISQCVWCRHRSADGRRCKAFPKGIPEAILSNRHDHRYAFDGDYGVRFEPEVVEIEFVDVEGEPEFVALSAELAVAVARAGDQSVDREDSDIVVLDGAAVEFDEEAFDLDSAASG